MAEETKETKVLYLKPFHLQKIEEIEPFPGRQFDILAETAGCGYRILRWKNNRWECVNRDGTTTEDRLAIHHWCYLT